MFKFDREQVVFDFAGVKMGGQPGEYPTVLTGIIFYYGQDIVSDESLGIFDKSGAETLINDIAEISDVTGNPYILEMRAKTPEAISKYIEFIGDFCDAPFIIESMSDDARIAGARYADDVGLADRAIYQSINITTTQSELDALAETDITSSIVLGFNPDHPTLAGKMAIWENGDGVLEKGLLDIARDCGIDKFMMDTAVTPLGNGAGIGIRANMVEKLKWGYPVGSYAHFTATAWDWLWDYKRSGNRDVMDVCGLASNVAPIMWGADFVSCGFIEKAKIAFPLVALTDILIAESLQGHVETVENHPINILL